MQLDFWKSWSPGYRRTWYVISGVLMLSLIFLWYYYFQGNDAIIHWEKFQEQKVVESTIHTFKVGPFELSVPAENFVIFEYFNGSAISPNTVASHIYLSVFVLSAIILLTIITMLDRFWFITGVILFILFVVSLRLDVLLIFNQSNYIPTVTLLVAVVGLSTWFNVFKPETTFVTRLFIFAALTIITGLIIGFFSTVNYPILHLSVTSYPAAIILTLLFVLLVSHEIPASFLLIVNRAGTGSGSLLHFVIITFIYLFNLILTALHEIDVIDWNFIYLNPYLLLTISGLAGLWGFRVREPVYQNILPFHPLGAFLFMSLGAIAFITTGDLLGNANDAALRIIRDVIIFSHLGFGLIFFTYVLSNFINVIGQNLPVDKVLYKPRVMPYFTFQFAGLIATLAFIFYVGWQQYIYHGVSGFYNQLGDLDIKLHNIEFAKAHYQQARGYGFRNHHANYAMAKLNTNVFNLTDVHEYYEAANAKRPSEYSLVNDGNVYTWEGHVEEAINSYKHAAEIFPRSGVIENNLGFAYGKIYKIDSAVHYLNDARDNDYSKPSAEANFFGLAAVESIPVKADSIVKTFGSQYTATLANAMAVATAQVQEFSIPVVPLSNQHLNLYTATLLNNYLVRNVKTVDTTFIRKAYEIADDSLNEDFSEALKVTIASAYYHSGNIDRALRIMAELAYISQSYQGKYNYLMGLWAMEQGNYELAASYFDYAVTQDYKDANLYKAIALAEDGQFEKAKIAWDTVSHNEDEGKIAMAERMKNILTLKASDAFQLSDPEKYQFCRYRLNVYDTTAFDKLVATFQNDNYKAKALFDMAQRQFHWDRLNTAINYFTRIGGLQLTDQALYDEISHFELLMLAEQRQLQKLAQQINKGITFSNDQQLRKRLYTALLSEANSDTLKAEENYRILAHYNPYFEEGVIAAARYYRHHGNDRSRPYDILAEAVQVNNNSVKLWNAYIAEAMRSGFDEYAVSARERLEEIKQKRAHMNR